MVWQAPEFLGDSGVLLMSLAPTKRLGARPCTKSVLYLLGNTCTPLLCQSRKKAQHSKQWRA